MNSFCVSFYADFETEYQVLLHNNIDTILQANKIISFLEKKIKELHNWLKNYLFETQDEEIYFFKELKPKIVSKLIYYKTVLKLESNAPATKKLKRKFYEKALNKIYQYSKKNKEFYEYYRSRNCFNDNCYFIRNSNEFKGLDDCYLVNYDEKLCTSHDYKVAILMSNDLINVFLENKIEEIERSCKIKHPIIVNDLSWTNSKIDLVELVYALHEQKVFNGGNTDVKEIAACFGKMFNVELEENIYRSYIDIKSRKSNRTKFLTSLSESLNEKIHSEEF